MWHTYLGQVFIFLYGLMRVIIKTEVRKMIFGHAVIAWIFFPDFLLLQNLEFWAFEGLFQAKKTKRCERRRYYKELNSWNISDVLLPLIHSDSDSKYKLISLQPVKETISKKIALIQFESYVVSNCMNITDKIFSCKNHRFSLHSMYKCYARFDNLLN